jgi:hypothetical protein
VAAAAVLQTNAVMSVIG